jgi:hypothetical protein
MTTDDILIFRNVQAVLKEVKAPKGWWDEETSSRRYYDALKDKRER